MAPSHQDKATATVSLKASPTAPSSLLELLTKRGLLPRTKCRCRSTPRRRVTRRVHKMLAAARLLSSELSQELIPITSTKHSHKCASAYMMYNEALRWLEMI